MKKRLIVLAAIATLAALAGATQVAQATYPGGNGRLAFAINLNGNTDIYTVKPDGQGLRRITDDPAFEACPAYSADGKRIAYCSGQGSPAGVFEIWTMTKNGMDKQQLTHLGGSAIFPDFSPSGRRVAFGARPAGETNTHIYAIRPDGTDLQQLTTGSWNDLYPAYSPNGRRIVFLSSRTGTLQVWEMRADGSDQTQLTFDAAPKDQVPDWSPDGSTIAYVADVGAGPGGDIWLMNADGSDQHPLTSGPPNEYGAAWSPDGEQIAFLNLDDRTVYVMNADGTGRHAVSAGGIQFVPGWQPRGHDHGGDHGSGSGNGD